MMSQIPCKQSIKIEMTGWFKHYFPGKTCLVPRFFTGERVGQRGFLKVLVTGIVTNRKQKIPSQITGKIVFKPTGHFYFYQYVINLWKLITIRPVHNIGSRS